MKKIIIITLSLLSLIGCKTEKSEVGKVSLSPVILNNDLETNFPNEMYVSDNYIFTPLPMLGSSAIGILDIKTGELIGRAINFGKGPLEFVTPKIQQIINDKIFLADLNMKKEAILPIEDALMGKNSCEILSRYDVGIFTRVQWIDERTRVYLVPGESKLFKMLRLNKIGEFGNPFTEVNITNGFNKFQGEICYHTKKKLLVYTNFYFQYVSIYKYNNKNFQLIAEIKNYKKLSYKNNKLLTDNTKAGIAGLTLAKDYIVCIQRDYTTDKTDESKVGRDFQKLPHTIYTYTFDGKLDRIVDLGHPVLRIASNQNDNIVFAIIFSNDSFKIAKYQL